MSHTTPPSRYDLPWKTALTHAFRDFMTFFFADLCSEINWNKRPRSRDKELAGISFGGATDIMVADKLIEVCLRDGSPRWILIHIEVQAQRDTSLGARMLDYNYRIFHEYNQPVASLVLLADDDPNWRPHSFWNRALRSRMGIDFPAAKLLDYSDRKDELSVSHSPFALITLAHLHTQEARHDPAALYAAKWHCTKLLYQHGWSKKRIITLFKAINWMMALPEQHHRRYWRALLKLEEEQKMECLTPLEQMFLNDGIKKGLKQGRVQGLEQGLEKGLEKGRVEGRAQGRELGRQEGALALLERLLTRRFGPLPKTVKTKLAKASLSQLEAWSDKLEEAQSLQQVFR